jgi:glycosyltransferase involved in cell wall biosynthesis
MLPDELIAALLLMRILAITNIYPSARSPSSGVFVQEQVKGLRDTGVDVRVLFVDRKQDGPLTYYTLAPKVAKAVAEFEPDVIHVMYGGVMAHQILRHHYSVPVVLTFRGSDLLGQNFSGWARKAISRYGMYCSRRAAAAADAVIVVARHLERALNGAACGKIVRVIPSGIDLHRFKPMDSHACKRRLGWNARSFHVLFASSSGDPVKRPELARAAVAQMNGESSPAELHYMTGIPTSEVPLWINASDAVLLTSAHEGSPNIIKEALACGVPVVSVDVGDVAEQIAGIAGCHLANPEAPALAARLRLVRQSGQRLDCRTHVARYSITRVAEKLKECYQEVTAASFASRTFVNVPRRAEENFQPQS